MIKISVCIPVYNTEQYLIRCLESVVQAAADFKEYEILVCSDASPGNTKDLCNDFNVRFFKHNINKGLTETRRTLVNNALGEYILMLDSDDTLMPDIFSKIYQIITNEHADIMHCLSNIRFNMTDPVLLCKNRIKNCVNIHFGRLIGKDIVRAAFFDADHHTDVWGKLIKRSLYVKAFQSIPIVYCNMLENVLQYFFISFYATKYIGTNICTHMYTVNTGMTSCRRPTPEESKRHVASIHNCFQTIFSSKEFASLSDDFKRRINSNYAGCVARWTVK